MNTAQEIARSEIIRLQFKVLAGAQVGNKNAAGPHKAGTKVWVGNSIGNIEDHDSNSNEYLVSVTKSDAHGVFTQGTKVHHTIHHNQIHVAPSQFQDKNKASDHIQASTPATLEAIYAKAQL
jgi:hypothetical protein